LGAFGGYIAQEIIPVGEIFHIQNLTKFGNNSYVPQDLSCRVNNFWITYTKELKTDQFYSDLSILGSDGKELKRKVVFVNEPLIYKDLVLYQTDWDIVGLKLKLAGNKSFQLPLKRITKGGNRFWFGSLKLSQANEQNFTVVINDLKGKIVLYEDEYDGFIKFDFSGFESRWNDVDDLVKSTMEFEGTDPDWGQGYGKGAYRIMLTHKSTLGVSALLFEILLEFVSGIRGKGICSDRSSITIEAQKKWHIYANRSDIELEQLDINKDDSKNFGLEQLTPDDVSDDTSQAISIRHKGDEWYDSIFSKVFKKKGIQTIKYIANNSDQLELSVAIINPGELTSKI